MSVSHKPQRLYFYTNMPTPYQLDFFDALASCFRLKVFYFTAREKDRQWKLSKTSVRYETVVLKNNWVSKLVQKFVTSFHYDSSISETVRAGDADAIIVNGTYWSPNIYKVLRAASNKSIPVYFWGEPVFPVASAWKKFIKKQMLAPVLKYTTALFAIGKRAEESYRWYGYSKPIYNIPYNINTDLFRSEHLDPAKRALLRDKYAGNDDIVLLTSGALIERKGMDILIRAMQLITTPNLKLWILGDGEKRMELEELAAGDPRICFLGFQQKEDIPYWFSIADIFVFASRYDGWGLVINEAMAGSNAIISSLAVGAAADLLTDGENGLLVDTDDVSGFSRAMERLVQEPEFRSALAKAANATGERISSKEMAKRVHDICRTSK